MLHKKSQKNYFNFKLFLRIFSLTLLTIVIIFSIFYYFKVEAIDVKSKNKNYIFLGRELIMGKNLFLLNTEKLRLNLENLNPKIKNLKINKEYPNKINITFTLEKPAAYIKSNEGYLFLSNKGKIIHKSKSINIKDKLTQINYYQTFDYLTSKTGSYIDFIDLKYSLNVLTKLGKYKHKVISIDISRPSMIRFNLDDSIVLFTSEKNIEEQIKKLEKIILQFKIEGNDFSFLDLRFDKPILKYK